jgi:hypothetical protein
MTVTDASFDAEAPWFARADVCAARFDINSRVIR